MEIAARWEAATTHFIEAARSQVPSHQAFSTAHVLIAALQDAPTRRDSVKPLLRHLSERQRDQCVAALRVELALHGAPATTPGEMTPDLAEAFTAWDRDAVKRLLFVSPSFILWHILMHDAALRTMFETLGIDVEAVTHSLEHDFDPRYSETVEPIAFSGPGTLYKEVKEVIQLISPSSKLKQNLSQKPLYAGMHAVLMANVLNVLGKLEHSQIAVLGGPHGTPISVVDQVLADMLDSKEYSVEDRPRLMPRYEYVYRVNMPALQNFALIPDKHDPYAIFKMAMEEAKSNRAIVVLQGLETLAAHTDAARRLIGALGSPGDALILGLYETGIHGDTDPAQALELQNAVEIAARPYSTQQTLALMREYYLPMWEDRYNYVFAENAFTGIIALEPGSWINLRRKTLPYLVVGLALDTIQTARGGRSLIRDTAQMALDALNELEEEWATTDRKTREKYKDVLDHARVDIGGILNDPQPKRDPQGRYVLTGANMLAQLICPNDSEFHYPGHGPPSLALSRMGDLPR